MDVKFPSAIVCFSIELVTVIIHPIHVIGALINAVNRYQYRNGVPQMNIPDCFPFSRMHTLTGSLFPENLRIKKFY